MKDSICTSDNVDQLSAFEETFFYRLIVNCDDYGRMDARAKILAARLFPLKGLKEAQINDALRALSDADLIKVYEVDGKPYLQMKTWERHQQVRARRSKYPSPDDGTCSQLQPSDTNCEQMISNDSKCPRNPIQSNPNPNPIQNEKRARDAETADRFARFWAAYPRKEAKKNAEAAFRMINPDEDLLARMLESIAKWAKSEQWTKDGQAFIPHPSTWLNGRRWEDEPPRPASGAGGRNVSPINQFQQRDYSGAEKSLSELLDEMEASNKAMSAGGQT